MVKRCEKTVKFRRWCIYFPKDSRMRTWKKTLGDLVADGNAGVDFRPSSASKVELVWPKPVTVSSALRLIGLATTRCNSFQIVGQPRGIRGDGDDATAPAAGGEEEPPASEVMQDRRHVEESPGKRQRCEDSDSDPLLTVFRSRELTRSARASAPCEPASPATGHRNGCTSRGRSHETMAVAIATRATSAFAPPCRLLSMKVENLGLLFSGTAAENWAGTAPKEDFPARHEKYLVSWDRKLGQGAYAKVFVGTALAEGRSVALKLFERGSQGAPGLDAETEVRRFCALPPHPNIVKLLDVHFFPQRTGTTGEGWGRNAAAIGLVFDLFDTDARQFLKKMPLQMAGARHLLRSLLAALACMHAVGLLHADVKPANILLRGAGPFRKGFLRMLANADEAAAAKRKEMLETADERALRLKPRFWTAPEAPVKIEAFEVTHHLPQSFEVGVGLGRAASVNKSLHQV